MDIKEKIAVLKLAGFEVQLYGMSHYEWIYVNEHGGVKYLGAHNYSHPDSTWESAWQFLQGDKSQEIDNDAWGTR